MCSKTLEKGGLSPAEEYLDRYPHELSGGQLQRISILRAMMLNPSFIVADEPVSMLDVSVQAQIMALLREVQERTGVSYLLISHDLDLIRHSSSRVGIMREGRILEQGETEAVFEAPRHDYTKALIRNFSYMKE